MIPNRILAIAFVLGMVVTIPASAQLRPPAKGNYPTPDTWFASVTFVNKSEITVDFTATWDGKAAEKLSLEPGKSLTTRTTFKAGAKELKISVSYETGIKEKKSVAVENLKAGMDTKNTNLGKVYDFQVKSKNGGDALDLSPR